MDEIHIPTGVGDRLLEQMLARSRPDKKITFSVGGQKLFNGIFVILEDTERNTHYARGVTMQDIEHIDWLLDDMECQLNDYLEEMGGIFMRAKKGADRMENGRSADRTSQWMHPTASEIYDSMTQSGYLMDDETWRARERLALSSQARKDVASMAKQMLGGKDWNNIAQLLGVKGPTLKSKVNDGRFTAPELVALAYLCGYEIQAVDRRQPILEGVLE